MMREADRGQIAAGLRAARARTLELVAGLARESDWQVPYLRTVNPPLWEIGHVAWFQEFWCRRWRGTGAPPAPSVWPDADAWFDSRNLPHMPRWHLPLPSPDVVRQYMQQSLEASLAELDRVAATPDGLYFHRLALFHEFMHIEAQAYTWQTLGRPLGLNEHMPTMGPGPTRFLPVDGGVWELGSKPAQAFVFDNEKWAHPVVLEPFEIAHRPVSNAEFAAFVEDDGYRRPEYWDPEHLVGPPGSRRDLPAYWRRECGRVQRRHFERWQDLPADQPVVHVNAHEARAYCRWAGGDLPSEAQWEKAVHVVPGLSWGDRVWEWTTDTFGPFEAFSADPYAEYSQPAFGVTTVVRGGSYLTPRGLVHPKFRNFFASERHDMFVGFRVCRS